MKGEILMQTFLPYPDYSLSALCLHPIKHLGNQFYREGLTLLRGGWKNHPASKMWQGYEYSLCDYLIACYWQLREYGKNYQKHYFEVLMIQDQLENTGKPFWLGNEKFHASHRSNLLRKDIEKGWNWYCQFGWAEPPDLEYIWPA